MHERPGRRRRRRIARLGVQDVDLIGRPVWTVEAERLEGDLALLRELADLRVFVPAEGPWGDDVAHSVEEAHAFVSTRGLLRVTATPRQEGQTRELISGRPWRSLFSAPWLLAQSYVRPQRWQVWVWRLGMGLLPEERRRAVGNVEACRMGADSNVLRQPEGVKL